MQLSQSCWGDWMLCYGMQAEGWSCCCRAPAPHPCRWQAGSAPELGGSMQQQPGVACLDHLCLHLLVQQPPQPLKLLLREAYRQECLRAI